jgi:uncharacterized protein (DUF1015 family)
VPEIQPFRGVRYRVPDDELSRVLCPPYDVIPPDYQKELYDRDRRNIVRIVLNRTPGDGAYAEAGATYRGWVAAALLAPDPEPGLYVVAQDFEVGGRPLTRFGVLARFRVEETGHASTVLPHEHTRKEAKEDRYKLLKATRANFSPIFLMFSDAQGRFMVEVERVTSAPPTATYVDDGGVRHRLWRVTDPARIRGLQGPIAETKSYIADGHHRYATAQRLRDEVGAAGGWTLGYFTPMEAPGLVVLPYHRLLDEAPALGEARVALEESFAIAGTGSAAAAAEQVAASRAPYAFALVGASGGALVVEARPGAEGMLPADAPPSLSALDTFFLHQVVLPRMGVAPEAVRYAHSFREAEEALEKGTTRMAVLLRPTPVGQIVAVADARQSMPAKSTFFHPKLPSGLVVHSLQG